MPQWGVSHGATVGRPTGWVVLAFGGACASQPTIATDDDRDGYGSTETGGADCDDADPLVHPGAIDDATWRVGAFDDLLPPYPDRPFFALALQGESPRIFCAWEDDVFLVSGSEDEWTVEPVDLGMPIRDPSLALDEAGFAHVVFTTGAKERSEVWYATNAGDTWRTEGIADGIGATRQGIAIDGQGRVHVGFQDAKGASAHAMGDSGAWRIETLRDRGCPGPIAASSAGAAHLVSTDDCTLGSSDGAPVYATNVTGEWTIDVLTSPLSGNWVSFALGRDLVPRVAVTYVDERIAPWSVYFARREGGVWSHETVSDEGGPLSMALHPGGEAHLVAGETYYARSEYGDWTTEPYTPETVAVPEVAVSEDAVHVVYSIRDPLGQGLLRYARRALPNGSDDDCDGVAW